MSSGFQEIFLIVVILLAVFFIPRMMSPQRRPATKPLFTMGRLMTLGVRWRLALVVTLLWLLGAVVYFRLWQGFTERFLLFGLGPVVIGWCVAWVVAGYGLRRKN